MWIVGARCAQSVVLVGLVFQDMIVSQAELAC
jgi:hypothetical protein